jgi:hypothetical protein
MFKFKSFKEYVDGSHSKTMLAHKDHKKKEVKEVIGAVGVVGPSGPGLGQYKPMASMSLQASAKLKNSPLHKYLVSKGILNDKK